MRSTVEGQARREDPRIERTRARLRAAALDELVAVGWGALTVEGVARRAGAGKASVYRIYGDRTALLVDAFTHGVVQPTGDGGEPAPVRVILLHLVEGWGGPLLPALLEAGGRDAVLAEALRPSAEARLAGLRRSVAAELARRGDDRDADAVATALAGSLLYRRLVVPGRLAPEDVDEVLAAVLGPGR